MSFLSAGDVISGQEGTVTFKIDDTIETGAYVKQIEATMEKQKEEINTLGRRATQHKTVGWSGSGSMTLYYITATFRKAASTYAKTGKDLYFTITIQNNDPSSSIGSQTVALYRCNVDATTLAKLDTENTALDEDLDFTFEDFEILTSFSAPRLEN